MNEDKGKFVVCLKPLFQGYWGYLRSEREATFHDKRLNRLAILSYLILSKRNDKSDEEQNLYDSFKDCSVIANKYIDGGFDNYHKQSLIGLISGFELSIEGFMMKTLMTYEDAALQFSKFINLEKNSLKKILPLESENDAKSFFNELTSKARQTHKGISQYIVLLPYWDICPKIAKREIELVNEAKAIRNCIIHNNAIIDESSVRLSPTLKTYINQEIKINEDLYNKYYKATTKVHQSITAESYKSKYLLSKFIR